MPVLAAVNVVMFVAVGVGGRLVECRLLLLHETCCSSCFLFYPHMQNFWPHLYFGLLWKRGEQDVRSLMAEVQMSALQTSSSLDCVGGFG